MHQVNDLSLNLSPSLNDADLYDRISPFYWSSNPFDFRLMKVYTLQNTDCCGGDYISVFTSMDAVLERLKITAHHEQFDVCEVYKIECHDVITLEEQQDRTKRVIKASSK